MHWKWHFLPSFLCKRSCLLNCVLFICKTRVWCCHWTFLWWIFSFWNVLFNLENKTFVAMNGLYADCFNNLLKTNIEFIDKVLNRWLANAQKDTCSLISRLLSVCVRYSLSRFIILSFSLKIDSNSIHIFFFRFFIDSVFDTVCSWHFQLFCNGKLWNFWLLLVALE